MTWSLVGARGTRDLVGIVDCPQTMLPCRILLLFGFPNIRTVPRLTPA
jgi:hypothetical protein